MSDNTACPDCFKDLFGLFALDGEKDTSLFTSFVNELFALSFDVEHAHTNSLVRAQALLLLSDRLLKTISIHIEDILTETDNKLVMEQFLTFCKDKDFESINKVIKEGLNSLPLYGKIEKEKIYVVLENPGTVN